MAQCDFCFRSKSPLQPPYPHSGAQVCKACFYTIERVIGFINHYGGIVVQQSSLETPPNPPKPKSKREEVKDKGIILPPA